MTTQPTRQDTGESGTWTIACRDDYLREVGEPDTWSAAAAIGVEGVEVMVDFDLSCPLLVSREEPYAIADGAGVSRLASDAAAHGRTIAAFCLMNRFRERPEEEIACTVKVARIAEELRVGAIRLDILPFEPTDPEPVLLEASIEIGRRIVRETEGMAVRFGVENHGHVANKLTFLRPLLAGVGSDRFGMTLDTANFYWYGSPLEQLYKIYEELAPHTCHTHCKNIGYPIERRAVPRPIGWKYDRYCCPLDEGDIDFKRVGEILRKNNYAGDLCIENESLERYPKREHRGILEREAGWLHRMAARFSSDRD